MNMKQWLAAAGMLTAFAGFALDISGYKALAPSRQGENLLKNPSFLDGKKYWHIGTEYEVGPYGPNIVPALRIVRKPGCKPGNSSYQQIRLKPQTTYRFGGRMYVSELKYKSAHGTLQTGRAALGVDWLKNGKTVYGFWPCDMHDVPHGENNKWVKVQYQFTTPADPDLKYICFPYISQSNVSGEVRWTDLFFEEAQARSTFGMIHPKMHTLADGDGEIELLVSTEGRYQYPRSARPALRCILELENADGKKCGAFDAEIVRDRAIFHIGRPRTGEYTLRLRLADTANRCILDTGELPLTVAPAETRAANCSSVDRYGRIVRNGKPILPIGLYTWAIQEESLKMLQGSGFNMLTPYGTLYSRQKSPSGIGVETLLADLDLAQRYGIMICPDLRDSDMPKKWAGVTERDAIRKKAVVAARNHPAVLAWYMADEPAPLLIDRLKKIRREINRLDPNHPTWAVYNNPAELFKYAGVADIPAVDPYPIRGAAPHNQELVVYQADCLRKNLGRRDGTGALWLVPQLFSWTLYTRSHQKTLTPEYLRQCQTTQDIPTGREMLSMALAGAIHGVKGYVFYSMNQSAFVPAIRVRQWHEAVWMSKILAAQSDLILGVRKAPELQLKIRKGKVLAKSFCSDAGKVGIFAVAIGPEESEAEITLPGHPGLKSVTGAGTETVPGVYLFKGQGIDCDILR